MQAGLLRRSFLICLDFCEHLVRRDVRASVVETHGRVVREVHRVSLTLSRTRARAYESPFVVVASHPVGTEVRAGIINAYQHTQRLLCIAGICLCIPLIAFSMCLRDPRLPDEQSRAKAEGGIQAENAH